MGSRTLLEHKYTHMKPPTRPHAGRRAGTGARRRGGISNTAGLATGQQKNAPFPGSFHVVSRNPEKEFFTFICSY